MFFRCGHKSHSKNLSAIYGHKMVLASASALLKSSFLSNLCSNCYHEEEFGSPLASTVIILPDFSPSVVQAVLQLFYGGYTKIEEGDNAQVQTACATGTICNKIVLILLISISRS